MIKPKILVLAVFIVCFASAIAVSAHQPRNVIESENSPANPFVIEDPEISKAYYGELKGNPDYYIIDSAVGFNLYVNILSPNIEGARTDFIIDITSDSESFFINGSSYEWEIFFEEFARDEYLMGPELEKQVPAGEYSIKVYNVGNMGRYSLAVGKIESFPPGEIIRTYLALPSIKSKFFEKSPLSAFANRLGLLLLVIVALGIFLLVIFFKGLKKYRVEQPKYALVRKIGNIEIRKYPKMAVAETDYTSDNESFGNIFSYISGRNSKSMKISMTAPVINSYKGKNPFMSFLMPSRIKFKYLPKPSNKLVRLKKIRPKTIAVIRFSGIAGQNKVKRKESELLKALKKKRIKTKGKEFLMRYNPPWTPPLLRRNEIGVEVKK